MFEFCQLPRARITRLLEPPGLSATAREQWLAQAHSYPTGAMSPIEHLSEREGGCLSVLVSGWVDEWMGGSVGVWVDQLGSVSQWASGPVVSEWVSE